MRPSSCRGKK
jgi:hypothetical protein